MNKMKFDEANLSQEIKRAVSDMGFEYMSPIQEKAIPEMMNGIDIIGQAQTGTGKTAAFGIPLLEKVNTKNNAVQAIILCPTRELSIQVADELMKLSKYKKGISILPVYGGQPIDRQIKRLKKGVHIVVGTPGRVIDHINRRTLKLGAVETVVLDEADEMFDMGFRDDIERIVIETPTERQTVFFSATMPKEIVKFTKKYQKDPVKIKVITKQLTAKRIEQLYFNVRQNAKTEAVARLLNVYQPNLSIIFCNTKRKVDDLVADLERMGYKADALHGDLRQTRRDKVMARFRKGTISILVATDVAARGIDVDDVDLVINYDLPQDLEYYVHRIGRTGRAGREGLAVSLVSPRDRRSLKDIERYTKTPIEKQELPTKRDLDRINREKTNSNIVSTIEDNKLDKELRVIDSLIEMGHDEKIIAAAILKLYNLETQVEIKENKNLEYKEAQVSSDADDMDRMYINVGKRVGIQAKHILGAIAGDANLPKEAVGKIDIFDKFTFVNVDKAYSKQLIKKLNNKKIKGKQVNIEYANRKK